MLLTCKGWYAALSAAPHVMPTAVIKGFKTIAPSIENHLPEYSSHNTLAVQQAAHASLKRRAEVLEQAAALSPCTVRVKLTHFDDQVGTMVHASCHQAGLQLLHRRTVLTGLCKTG